MPLDQIKQILDLLRQYGLSELEVEHDGLRLKVRKEGAAGLTAGPVVSPPFSETAAQGVAAPGGRAPSASPAPGAPSASVEEVEFAVVKSPIVGTFYRSAEPDAPAFVEIGSRVKKGQVLCIIEAMKLMNEIDSEYEGEIVSIYVENGQPVQYGERLFAIRAT